MEADQAIDITAEQCKTVMVLLERHLPGTVAWVYGFRAKWTAWPQSDFDLVVFATPKQNGCVDALQEAFKESGLPFQVYLAIWDNVPDSLKEQVIAEHVVLVGKSGEQPEEMKSGKLDDWCETVLGNLVDIKTWVCL